MQLNVFKQMMSHVQFVEGKVSKCIVSGTGYKLIILISKSLIIKYVLE